MTEPPAPSHPIARGRAGPNLLALVLASKFAQHLPLNRQSATFARERVEIDVSTLADWVGACAASLDPLVRAVRTHVFAAERLHADDTPVPVLAKHRSITGRLWTYVRDDRPFGGPDPPAAAFFYSRDRGGHHPEAHLAGYAGIMQADAYAGFSRFYEQTRTPGPILEAACFAHARRKFFELAQVAKAPIAAEAVRRIDALFEIEREINGLSADERLRVRRERSQPLVNNLEAWLGKQRSRVSAKSEIGKAISYSLKRWPALTCFLDDGRICMTNNGAERALRGIAIGRANWTFAGSDRGGERAAAGHLDLPVLRHVGRVSWAAGSPGMPRLVLCSGSWGRRSARPVRRGRFAPARSAASCCRRGWPVRSSPELARCRSCARTTPSCASARQTRAQCASARQTFSH